MAIIVTKVNSVDHHRIFGWMFVDQKFSVGSETESSGVSAQNMQITHTQLVNGAQITRYIVHLKLSLFLGNILLGVLEIFRFRQNNADQ